MKRIIALVALFICLTGTALAGSDLVKRAAPYLPVLQEKVDKYWPTLTIPYVLAGQVEQESQWNVHAQLKTSRELGRGLAQMTITPKFNIYKVAVTMKPLRGWDWQKDPWNPANQLTFLVLMDKDNFTQVEKLFENDQERLAASYVAYNAGLGTVLQRRALAIRQGKEHKKWFGGLEDIRLPYENRKLYGRNLGEMRNEYPRVIFKRAEKYRNLMK